MAKILLVEPDRTLAGLYKSALQQDGHEVLWQRTAASAIAKMDETKVDLVVLELNMALHNGVEFLYEMRSYPDWQSVRVILHTNVREKQIQADALKQLDVSKFLYKPATTLSQLKAAVTDVQQVS